MSIVKVEPSVRDVIKDTLLMNVWKFIEKKEN